MYSIERVTHLRAHVSSQLVQLAVRDCASDSSPYVRKCAANAIPKIFVLDPDQGPQLCQVNEYPLSHVSSYLCCTRLMNVARTSRITNGGTQLKIGVTEVPRNGLAVRYPSLGSR